MSSILDLIRPDLRDFVAYSSARDEAKAGRLWLNANESPFESHKKINRYPEKQPKSLMKKIADLFQMKPEQVLLSRGSDEAIDLLVRLFCRAEKDAILICPPTYGMYSVCARLQGAFILEIPLMADFDFQLNVPAILESYTDNVKIIFLCSPNNPTGNLLKKSDIITLCQHFSGKALIVVDEAYIDFAEEGSVASSINEFENLAVLRTFSKAYGMAAARLGVVLAHEALIQWLLKIMAPYPLPTLSTDALQKALEKEGLSKMNAQIASIKSEREKLLQALKALPFIQKVWPSQSNYLLAKTVDSDKIMKACEEKGVIIRCMFDKKGLENCIRITVGLPEENAELIKILEEVAK